MSEVEKVLGNEKIIKSMEKIKKEKVEVDINPKKFLLEYTKEELVKLESQTIEGLSEADAKLLEQTKENYKKNIEEYSQARLQATMVPLKYRDLQIIKNGVFEAVQTAQQYNWDDAVKIRAMIREERTLTVYLSLRKKDNIAQSYYPSLEEICKETDTTIDELYNIYLENFVLTDEERKNS
jgi:hypothetical protein